MKGISIRKFLIGESFEDHNKQLRRNVLWNSLGAMLNAAQSFLLLLAVTRFISVEVGGIFSLAFATANLLMNIGNYGIRNFQVTDIQFQYSFKEYLGVRGITCLVMLILSIMISLGQPDSGIRNRVILLLCIFKLLECIEDLFLGRYHQMGRLDVAGKQWFFRTLLSMLTFAVVIVFSRDLIVACELMVLVTGGCILGMALLTYPSFRDMENTWNKQHLIQILRSCFPLCATSFFNVYLLNASKYSIDRQMTEEYQTYYSILFMPVFVINLLSGFLYKPILYDLTVYWKTQQYRRLVLILMRQIMYIAGICVLLIIFASSVELPVLSWVYHVDVTRYWKEYKILLIGGAFSAGAIYLSAFFTVIRKQVISLSIIALCSLIAFLGTDWMVEKSGFLGASISYCLIMFLQILFFFIISAVLIWKKTHKTINNNRIKK